jgi:hypothetical protein
LAQRDGFSTAATDVLSAELRRHQLAFAGAWIEASRENDQISTEWSPEAA